MRFSFGSLIRLMALFAAALTLGAVGLSRAVPRQTLVRVEGHPRYAGINGTSFDPPRPGSYLLDTEDGTLAPLKPVGGCLIEYAGCSPWRDARGEYEIVGRATVRHGKDHGMVCEGSGLARFTLHGPSVCDETPVDPVVTGRPCWVPGDPSRVVFPAGDGRLYVQGFPDDLAREAAGPPRLLAWACPYPGGGDAFLNDPVAPAIPALGGRLFVALQVYDPERPKQGYGRPEIWWLKLGPEGHTVTDAGRVTRPGGPPVDERLPNLSVAPDGRIVLAYLSRNLGRADWTLHLATVVTDPESGEPGLGPEGSHEIGRGYSTNAPAFSDDGRWIYALARAQRAVPTARAISVVDALAPGRRARATVARGGHPAVPSPGPVDR